MALSGGYAYVADRGGGLRILDVSNPAQPVEVGVYDTPYQVMDVAVRGQYAYLADQDYSFPGAGYLRILDVSDPAHPTQVGVFEHTGDDYATSLALAGEYAYLVGHGVTIISVADPANPVWVRRLGYVGDPRSVTVQDNRAYVADEEYGVHLFDVADPANPVWLGNYDTPMNAKDMAAAGDYLYVADWEGGLVVLGPAALQVSPPALTFLAEAGGADPQPRTVSVASSGGPLAWTAAVSPTVGWLEATPLSGATPAEVAVSAHVAGLGIGAYQTHLVVTAGEEVAGSPAAIPVTLRVVEEVHRIYLPLILR